MARNVRSITRGVVHFSNYFMCLSLKTFVELFLKTSNSWKIRKVVIYCIRTDRTDLIIARKLGTPTNIFDILATNTYDHFCKNNVLTIMHTHMAVFRLVSRQTMSSNAGLKRRIHWDGTGVKQSRDWHLLIVMDTSMSGKRERKYFHTHSTL